MLGRSKRAFALVLVVATVATLGGGTPTAAPTRITIRIVWDMPTPLKPVFDCTDEKVRRRYPAQCPEAPVLIGGGGPATGGGGGACGICDLIGGLLGGLTGGLL
jgi:hypothetical protein